MLPTGALHSSGEDEMTVPSEFTADSVKERSPREEQLYSSFLRNRDPFQSVFENNPWLLPPDPRKPLEWGTGRYWDTTVARKHDYWTNIPLPQATKDIRRMRRDVREWGYCLVEEGMSAAQYDRLRGRVLEQAAGERLAGIAAQTPSGQYVHTLVNKGRCFAQCIEQDPEAVQAGPLIEQIMNETLGHGWICHSFLANGADPGEAFLDGPPSPSFFTSTRVGSEARRRGAFFLRFAPIDHAERCRFRKFLKCRLSYAVSISLLRAIPHRPAAILNRHLDRFAVHGPGRLRVHGRDDFSHRLLVVYER